VPQAFPGTIKKKKKSLWHICEIHMHFEKLTDPNPRFALFGDQNRRRFGTQFSQVHPQGLFYPFGDIKCGARSAPP
jgi:hypothetical protein